MSGSQRVVGVDIVRLVGIVAVVAGHVWTDGVPRAALYSWHVPLFFFLIGYFWTGGRSVRAEWRNRRRTLLVPYTTWLVVIGCVWYPWRLGTAGFAGPMDAIRPVLGGRYLVEPFSAFWFVTALAVAALVLRILERFAAWVRWTVAVAALAGATLTPGVFLAMPESIGQGIVALVFVLVGAQARGCVPEVRRPLPVGLALLTFGGIAVAMGSASLDLKQADVGTPVVSTVTALTLCVGLVLLGTSLDAVVPARWAAGVSALAACGIGVVLTHAVVIWVARPILPPAVLFVTATVLPWGVALLVGRTRAAPWFLGIPRRPARRAGAQTSVEVW